MEQSGLKLLLPFPSIRIQLLVIALVVFILPWLGIKTIREMENLLRIQQVQSLMSTAATVREGLASVSDVLMTHHERLNATGKNSEVILSKLPKHMLIDGYADDWPEDGVRLHYDSQSRLLDGKADTNIKFNLIAGYQSGALTLLFDITDDVLYQGTTTQLLARNTDSLLLGFKNNTGHYQKYVIGSNAPGWLSVLPMDLSDRQENRIHAELQVKSGGYTIEVTIPNNMVAGTIAFALLDHDNNNPDDFSIVGNASVEDENQYGLLFQQYETIQQPLRAYQTKHRKITVTDSRLNILASYGEVTSLSSTQDSVPSSLFSRFYQLLRIADAPVEITDIPIYRLNTDFVKTALTGQDNYQFQRSANGIEQLAVALPLVNDNQNIGTLVIEESTEAITSIRQQAIFNIFKMTLLAIAVVVAVLLLYATLLIGRIRRLNQQMQTAVSDDGRLHATIPRSILGDEIGDLNRGMATMIDRLREYQRYMETMASKLSHELRTPLTVVQSSLENLQGENDPDKSSELLNRANEGLSRLRMILTNLTEASRLENALKTTDVENFDLASVIEGCVEGYRQAYPELDFEFYKDNGEFRLSGSPELMAQLLDKLVSNAVDFHTPDTPVHIGISQVVGGCELVVANQGPPLPQHLQGSLFDSMISEREKRDETPHLGLGLFVVRLIAEFHKGCVNAANVPGGVKITVSLP